MSNLSCVRIAKLKGYGSINAAAGHNTRSRETPGVNPAYPPVPLMTEPADLALAVKARIGEQRVRTNAVLAVELVLIASPEYFRPDRTGPEFKGVFDEAPTNAWAQASAEWLKATYGDRLMSVQLHLDEDTPHIHAVMVPLDGNGKLNCRAIFGGGDKLAALQTDYSEAVKHLGIERGVEGLRVRGADHKKYHAATGKPVPEVDMPELPVVHTMLLKIAQPKGFLERIGVRQEETHLVDRAVAMAELTKMANKLNLAAIQAKEGRAMRPLVKDLKAAGTKLSRENVKLRKLFDEYRSVPALDVLRKVYDARVVSVGVYEVVAENGKTVQVGVKDPHHRVGLKGKQSKSAIDLVRAIEGWEPTTENAERATLKMSEKLEPGEAARAFALHKFEQELARGLALEEAARLGREKVKLAERALAKGARVVETTR